MVIPSKADRRTVRAIEILRGWQDNLELQFEIIVCGELAQGQVFEDVRFIKVYPALKGACVRAGALASHGSVVVVCDADIPLDELDFLRLLKSASVSGLAIGCRYYNHQTTHLRAPYYRQATSHVYRFLSSILFQLPRRLDTQCGIKAYSRPVAQLLFQNLTMLGLAYDIEVIARARLARIHIVSIPIQWKYSESSISLFRDGWGMLKDILLFRLSFRNGHV